MPQHIMSPADMLKLEKQLANESVDQTEDANGEEERRPKLDLEPGDLGMAFISGGSIKTRSRTNSILSNMSTSTLAFGSGDKSGRDDLSIRGVLGIAQTFGTPGRRPSTANTTRTLNTKPTPSSPSSRPSTAQPNLSSPPMSPTHHGQGSPEHQSVGLPPPPRPRPAREKRDAAKRASILAMHPLSPPPRRRPIKPVAYQEDESASATAVPSTSSHPTPLTTRPPSAFEFQKVADRRSIMKKPSFLDIEDEFDQEDDDDTESLMGMSVASRAASQVTSIAPSAWLSVSAAAAAAMDMESSFLDLDRGKDSFDTVRSYDGDLRAF